MSKEAATASPAVPEILIGPANKSSHAKEPDRFPITNPVAWTKTYTGKSGIPARVFFTTLGHPSTSI